MRTFLLLVVLAATACSPSTPPSTPSLPPLHVSKGDFRDEWPLRVPEVVVECHGAKKVVLVAEGYRYVMAGDGDGVFPSFRVLLARNPTYPDVFISYGTFTDLVREYCAGQPVTLPIPEPPPPPVRTAEEIEATHQRALAIIREIDQIRAEEAVQNAAEAASAAADEAERAAAAAIAASKAAAEAVERAAAIRAASAN